MGRLTRLSLFTSLALGAGLGANLLAAPTASAAPATQVIVQPGDYLAKIGRTVNRSWPALAAYNHLSDPNLIFPGEVIKISPDGYAAPSTSSGPTPVRIESTPVAVTHALTYAPPPAPVSESAPSGVWACIARHESGSNPAENTGNGYYGMYQFTLGSWAAVGGTGNPADASAAEQTARAQRLQAIQGWGAWPVTSRVCGA